MSRWHPHSIATSFHKDEKSGCWLWDGSVNKSTGYGVLSVDGVRVYAHRHSYEVHRGPIPTGILVCHTCDVRRCVRPDHLFLGTIRDNVQDMWNKGRGRPSMVRGSAQGRSVLTESDIPTIRRRLGSGESQRSVAKSFGVGQATIQSINVGRSWKHIGGGGS